MYNQAFNRLPERFRKPNNQDLYYVLYNGFSDIEDTFNDIEKSRDIDNAAGKTLDLIGANVGQFRCGEDDELYRLLIKTRIKANLSIGDIGTINEVSSILLKDIFLGIRETWNTENLQEPSAIVYSVDAGIGQIPFELINRIKSAGVKVYIEHLNKLNLYVGIYGQQQHKRTIDFVKFIQKQDNNIYRKNYNKTLKIIKTKAINKPLQDTVSDKYSYSGFFNTRTLRKITTKVKE